MLMGPSLQNGLLSFTLLKLSLPIITHIHRHIRLRPGIAMPFMAVAARISLHVSASRPLRPNVTSSRKPEVHKRSATPPQEDWATTTGHLHTKFRADRSSGSRDMLADIHSHRQTDAQTDGLITILRTLSRGGVTKLLVYKFCQSQKKCRPKQNFDPITN